MGEGTLPLGPKVGEFQTAPPKPGGGHPTWIRSPLTASMPDRTGKFVHPPTSVEDTGVPNPSSAGLGIRRGESGKVEPIRTRTSDRPKVSCHELRRARRSGRLHAPRSKDHEHPPWEPLRLTRKEVSDEFRGLGARTVLVPSLREAQLACVVRTVGHCAIPTVRRISDLR